MISSLNLLLVNDFVWRNTFGETLEMRAEVQVDICKKNLIMWTAYNPKCYPSTNFQCESINKVSV